MTSGTCKKVYKSGQCNDTDEQWKITSSNTLCESSYKTDCAKMTECNRGEPSSPVVCPKGSVHVTMHACEKECTGKCPDGEVCVDSMEPDKKACVDRGD